MKLDPNQQYAETLRTVELVRDCLEGEPRVKWRAERYLPYPSPSDKDQTLRRVRYDAYIAGAEFDGFPSETEKAMIGAMTEGEATIKLPEAIAHLEQNTDGDGTALMGAVESIYRNLLQVKYHVLLAEFTGLADVDLTQLSVADLQALKPKATIKQYTREAVIDWDFKRVGGVMQLCLLVLEEVATERDAETLQPSEARSRLLLALDENGHYYQQRFSLRANATEAEGAPHYPQVNGAPLQWIPAEIIVDEETPAGKIPRGLGYMYPICSAALSRYRVSADYKEALRLVQPTTFTNGWQQGDFEQFKELNGRDYIAFGAGQSNNLPGAVTVKVEGLGVQTEPFENYFKANERKARALGAKIEDGEESTGRETATQARINNGQRTAVMSMIVGNTEAALRRVISYCAMFQGLWGPEDVENNLDQIELTLPRKFVTTKMAPEEVQAVISAVTSGLLPKIEGVRKLVEGGFTTIGAVELMDELEAQGPEPQPIAPWRPGQPTNQPPEDEAENEKNDDD